MEQLKKHGLTLDNILKTKDQVLAELIRVVKFRNKKVQYIKKCSKIIKDKCDGKVPSDLKE